jgi:hypothetical protein
LPGSVVTGLDHLGEPCVFFLDPDTGPCMIGSQNAISIGADLGGTWATVNQSADRHCHGVYYADKRQVWWWIAANAGTAPNTLIVLNVEQMEQTREGFVRGWAKYTGTIMTSVASSCMFADSLSVDTVPMSRKLVPVIGGFATPLICQTEVTFTDHTTPYAAKIRTRPFLIGDLLRKVGIKGAAVVAKPVTEALADTDLGYVSIVGDFGYPTDLTLTRTFDLDGDGSSPDRVIAVLDNLQMAGCRTIEVEIGETAPEAADSHDWIVDYLVLALDAGEKTGAK